MTGVRRPAIDRYYRWISRFYSLHEGWFERALRETAIEFLPLAEMETILEIGCGTGFALCEIGRRAGPSASLHGIDISMEMLQRSRGRVSSAASVSLLRADAGALPYRDAVFDGAYMSGVLELYDDPDRIEILREARRVLKPGTGRLALATMTDDGRASSVLGAYERARSVLPGIIPSRSVDSEALAFEAGFEIRRTDRVRLKGIVPIQVFLLARVGSVAGWDRHRSRVRRGANPDEVGMS